MLDKFVDMIARRPSGWIGKKMYSNLQGHYKAFRLTLEKLALKPDDIFLEVGCGGGVLLTRSWLLMVGRLLSREGISNLWMRMNCTYSRFWEKRQKAIG